jgi:serine/threonine protein kinase
MAKMLKVRPLGDGIYGKVYEAEYLNSDKKYAVKRNYVDKSVDFMGSIKELDLISRINHPFFIGIENVEFDMPFGDPYSPITEPSRKDRRDRRMKTDKLHFIMEKADADMFTVLYRKNAEKLTYRQITGFMVQLLIGIDYIHALGIAHRDIKTSNILVKDGRIKICDLGMGIHLSNQERQSPNVITSWYRPPEVCYGYVDYGLNVDIWSLGCVFVEFVLKEPLLRGLEDKNPDIIYNLLILFQDYFSDRDWIQILCMVVKTLYVSTSSDNMYDNMIIREQEYEDWWTTFNSIFNFIKSKLDEEWGELISSFQEEFSNIKYFKTISVTKRHRCDYIIGVRKKIDAKKNKNKKEPSFNLPQTGDTLNHMLNNSVCFKGMPNKKQFKDLLRHMLEFDPKKRWSANQCLNHEYFRDYHEYIAEVKRMYVPKGITNSTIKIISCTERIWMRKIIQGIVNKKDAYPWYSMRKMFHAVDIYDRYLAWADYEYEHHAESDEMGRYHGKHRAIINFYVCLYVCIKYFQEVQEVMPFDTLIDKAFRFEGFLIKAEIFEHLLIETILKNKIYHKTLFEVSDDRGMRLSPLEMEYLLQNYCNHDSCETNVEDLYNEFLRV